jgi:hypothetical protein
LPISDRGPGSPLRDFNSGAPRSSRLWAQWSGTGTRRLARADLRRSHKYPRGSAGRSGRRRASGLVDSGRFAFRTARSPFVQRKAKDLPIHVVYARQGLLPARVSSFVDFAINYMTAEFKRRPPGAAMNSDRTAVPAPASHEKASSQPRGQAQNAKTEATFIIRT